MLTRLKQAGYNTVWDGYEQKTIGYFHYMKAHAVIIWLREKYDDVVVCDNGDIVFYGEED